MNAVRVTKASLADVPALASLATAAGTSVPIVNVGLAGAGERDKDVTQDANLAMAWDRYLRSAIDRGDQVLVCHQAKRVLGFLHAAPFSAVKDDGLRSSVDIASDHMTFLVTHIAVHLDYRRQGIATLLLDSFREAIRPLPIVTTMQGDPAAIPGMRLSRAQGMTAGEFYAAEDGRQWLVFTHPGALSDDVLSLRDLIEQYRVATSLYVHESRTNWTKVNNLFYVTAGLLAVGGLVLPHFDEGVAAASTGAKVALAGLLTLGVVSSTIFSVAIRAGLFYLHARKDAVMRLESRIVSLGGIPVVGPRALPEAANLLKRSPATKVMPLLPLIVGLAWSSAAVALIASLVMNGVRGG